MSFQLFLMVSACVSLKFIYAPVVDSLLGWGVIRASHGSRWVRPELGLPWLPCHQVARAAPGLARRGPPRRASFPGGSPVIFSRSSFYPPAQLLVWWERGVEHVGPSYSGGEWRRSQMRGVKTRRDGVGGDGARDTWRGSPPTGRERDEPALPCVCGRRCLGGCGLGQRRGAALRPGSGVR